MEQNIQAESGSLQIMTMMKGLVSDMVNALPGLIGAICVFLIGLILANMISKLIRRLLSKTKIDNLAQKLNTIDLFSSSNIRILPSVILSKIIYYFFLLVFIIAATDILGMPAVSELLKSIINYVPVILSAVGIFFIGVLFADFVRKLVLTTCNSLGIPSGKIISSFIFYLLFVAIGIMSLTQAGIETSFISNIITIVVAGLVFGFALGYGLASREVFSSFISSFYSKDKIKIGDIIQIEDISGVIIDIDRSSLVVRNDDGEHYIPLHKLSSGKFIIKKPRS